MSVSGWKVAVVAGGLMVGVLAGDALGQARRGGGGGRGGGGARGGGGTTAQPPTAQQVQNDPTVQADQKLASEARDVFNASVKALDSLFTKLMADFEKTPEMEAAKQAIKDARLALDAAKAPVLEQLKNQPEYVKAAGDEAAAKKKLSELKNAGAAQDKIEAQAMEVFKLGGITSGLEKTALDDSPEVKSAQKRLTIATTRLAEMRETFRISLKDNADYQAAKAARDDAEKKLTDADAKVTADVAKASGVKGY